MQYMIGGHEQIASNDFTFGFSGTEYRKVHRFTPASYLTLPDLW